MPILITMISEEESNGELLMEVGYEFGKVTEEMDVIISTERIKIFG